MPKLTTAAVAKITARKTRREISDAACPGLFLIVQPSGSKSFAHAFPQPVRTPRQADTGQARHQRSRIQHRAPDRYAADV